MSNVIELALRNASNLEKLMRAVLLDADNKIPADRLRIVGAIADGAIIEQGSNANGEWVRFANGTQICMKRLNELGPITLALPVGLYSSDNINIGAWPAVFISPPFCAYLSTESVKWYPTWIQNKNAPTATNGSQLNIVCMYSVDDTNFSVSAIAIGRWKA